MTQEQTCEVLSLIYAIYPRAYERQGLEATTRAWTIMFEEESAEVVMKAVKEVLKTSRFAPTISEVSAEIAKYKDGLKARLNQYNYYFNSLPEACRTCTVEEHWEVIIKCGARKCPREVTEAEKHQYYLTDEQVKKIKLILGEGVKC